MEELVSFAEIFTNETFDAMKKAIITFLEQTGASNASLEFEDKRVYLHSHKGTVQIHIVDSTEKEVPDLPEDDEEENESNEND